MKMRDCVKEETVTDSVGKFLHSGMVFTCPGLCQVKLSSWNYAEMRNWRKACALHVREKHGEYLEDCGLSKEQIDALLNQQQRRKGLAGGCSS
jgi:hypothetical protein